VNCTCVVAENSYCSHRQWKLFDWVGCDPPTVWPVGFSYLWTAQFCTP